MGSIDVMSFTEKEEDEVVIEEVDKDSDNVLGVVILTCYKIDSKIIL